VALLDAAEDEGLSSKAVKARAKEEHEADYGDAEVIETVACPRCKGTGVVLLEEA
jgi:hypothetical protein